MCRKIELGNLFFIPQRDIQLFPNKGYKLSTRLRVNIIPFQAPVYIFIEYCIREFDTQRKEREGDSRDRKMVNKRLYLKHETFFDGGKNIPTPNDATGAK